VELELNRTKHKYYMTYAMRSCRAMNVKVSLIIHNEKIKIYNRVKACFSSDVKKNRALN